MKVIKPGDVPMALVRSGTHHKPRICRIWSFTLVFGALQSLTMLNEAEDLDGSASPECTVQDRRNLLFFLQFMAPYDRLRCTDRKLSSIGTENKVC